MRKTMQAIIIQKLFKIGLLSCISLLLSFVGVMGSTETSYATSSKTLIDIGLLPGLSVDILPSSTPTPTPTPTPTSTPASASTPIQPANATAVSQVPPVPTSGVLSGSTT